MYLSLVFLPLINYLSISLFGRFIGKHGAVYLSLFSMFFCLCFTYISFYENTISLSLTEIKMLPWISSDLFTVNWTLYFDSLTSSMLVLVITVSFLVHLFSSEYMAGDPHLPRFMSYLSLFTFFMIILVSGNNFIQLFIGWEGVGLCSYLLINFWATRLQANKSAMKAMIVNRVGDLGLCLGFFLLFLTTGTLDFSSNFASIFYWIEYSFNLLDYQLDIITSICFFFCLGVVGKSAQLGLHTWLPDAMEGPTPVSALIHAATMVTAGVFLILRCSVFFELTNTGLLIVTFIGALTAFFAATVGIVQNDLKKVIAYSTCSQLGYMVFACGISMYNVSFFHLFNHGFFKALLFLSAGSIIHAVQDEQDMRKMGGLLQLLPFSYSMILIGSLSLMGTPFLTGFYSKDLILEGSYASYLISGHFSFWLGTVAASFTAFYSMRLIFLAFYNRSNGSRVVYANIHEAPFSMALPLIILAIASIFLGYIGKDLFVGPATNGWQNTFYINPSSLDLIEAEFIPIYIKLLPVVLSITGSIVSFVIYSVFSHNVLKSLQNQKIRSFFSFISHKWYFDNIYNNLIAAPLLRFGGEVTFKSLDKGIIELLGPYGLIKVVRNLSSSTSQLQTGYIHHSVFIMLVGIFFFISFFTFQFSFFNTYFYSLTTLCIISFVYLSFLKNE